MVPQFETCRKRVKKTRFYPPLTVYFFLLYQRVLCRVIYLVVVFSGPSWLSIFSADSLSRSVHCAPDENETF